MASSTIGELLKEILVFKADQRESVMWVPAPVELVHQLLPHLNHHL